MFTSTPSHLKRKDPVPVLQIPQPSLSKPHLVPSKLRTTPTSLASPPPSLPKALPKNLPKTLDEMQQLSGKEVHLLRQQYDVQVMAQAVGSKVGEVSQGDESKLQMSHLNPVIETAAVKYDIPKAWIEAVLKNESGGKVNAVSTTGALGPMQLTRYTYLKGGVFREDINPFIPSAAIDRGAQQLKILGDKYNGDIQKIAAAYHHGEPKIDALVERFGSAWQTGLEPNILKNYVQPIAAYVNTHTPPVASLPLPRQFSSQRL